MYPEIFWGDPFQQRAGGGGCVQGNALEGTRQQSSRILQGFSTLKSLLIKIYPPQLVMKIIQNVFLKILPKFEFEVNFSVQSYASLTREDPAYLQITYHYVYYLNYTELKSFFGYRVWAPKLVYQLLNPSGYVYDFGQGPKYKYIILGHNFADFR